MLNIDIVNKVEVIIEASLIATKDFHDESGEVSKKRTSDKRRLVKTTWSFNYWIKSLMLLE